MTPEEQYRQQQHINAHAQQEAQATEVEFQEFRRKQRDAFFIHLAVYFAVNLFLTLIDFVTGGGYEWAYWPLMGWGLGLVIHFIFFTFIVNRQNFKTLNKYHEEND